MRKKIGKYAFRLWLVLWPSIPIGGVLFVLLSLLSFVPGDLEYNYPPNTAFHNYGGKYGALLARFLYKWFGLIAYLIPLVVLGCSLLIAKISRIGSTWLLWGILFCGWCCLVVSYLETSPILSKRMPSYGGVLGLFCISYLRSHFGRSTITAIILIGTIALIFYAYTLWCEYRYLAWDQLHERELENCVDNVSKQ